MIGRRLLPCLLTGLLLMASARCGGGGTSTSSQLTNQQPVTPPVPEALSFSTIGLPDVIEGGSYNATLQAKGGTLPYIWSGAGMPSGLSLNASGVISGTANFSGNPSFQVQVTDSASPAATLSRLYNIRAQPVLKLSNNHFEMQQYANVISYLNVIGGKTPLSFSIIDGSLPPGLVLSTDNRMTGSPITQGTYQFLVRVRDSFSPPQEAVETVAAVVGPPVLSLANTTEHIPLGVPFNGAVVAKGGTPPYTYLRDTGPLPPGIGEIDTSTGQLSGTPTLPGSYNVEIKVTDSATPYQVSFGFAEFVVEAARGRNDTVATATPVGNGTTEASISPYIDPPNASPFPGDVDYYKLKANGGSIVHVETRAKRLSSANPLDTVLEIVDANDQRMNFCQVPPDTSGAYASPCLNDDLSSSPHIQDSALDFRAPGSPPNTTTFYVKVLDWRGDARPDMTYRLEVQGTLEPLFKPPSLTWAGIKGRPFSQVVPVNGGIPPVTCCSLVSGSLPPDLALFGPNIEGTLTATGEFQFTLRAFDSGAPSEVVLIPVTLEVTDPLTITTSAILPDACLNQPYSFTPQVTGGIPLYYWTFVPSNTAWPFFFSAATGITTGTPNLLGSFKAVIGVHDGTGQSNLQIMSISVKQCP